jgi:putative ABC transport system permease protein
LEILASDVKHAFRTFRRSPGFTVTAVAALALGIGANAAIFSVVDTVLLKPLPFPNADRIVILMNSSPQGNGPAASVPKYNVWRSQTQALQDVAAYDTGGPGLNLSMGDRPEQIKGIHVSHEFFSSSAPRRNSGAPSRRRKTAPAGAMWLCCPTAFGSGGSDRIPPS